MIDLKNNKCLVCNIKIKKKIKVTVVDLSQISLEKESKSF